MNPDHLLYAETHEWVRVEDKGSEKIATVGITAHAVEQLTDLIFMELPPTGSQVTAGSAFGEVESVKATSNLYSPVTGEVVEINQGLPDQLDLLNKDPYGAAWIMKVRLSEESALERLMDRRTYDQQAS